MFGSVVCPATGLQLPGCAGAGRCPAVGGRSGAACGWPLVPTGSQIGRVPGGAGPGVGGQCPARGPNRTRFHKPVSFPSARARPRGSFLSSARCLAGRLLAVLIRPSALVRRLRHCAFCLVPSAMSHGSEPSRHLFGRKAPRWPCSRARKSDVRCCLVKRSSSRGAFFVGAAGEAPGRLIIGLSSIC